MRFRLVLALLPLLGMVASPAMGDIIRLKDGRVLEGDLKRTTNGWIVRLADGGTVEVAAEQVQRVELKPATGQGPRGEALALQRLESLRRSVDAADDIGWIVGRYEEFLSQYRDTLAAEKAAEDLARWRERAAQGLVRLGDQWVTPEQRDALRIEATGRAAEARQLIKQGQTAAGRELLARALRTDPRNVTGLYLQALLDFEQGELGRARKALETVQSQMPDHPATLNNLAVIASRQNRSPDALALYEQAMRAAPEHELILQNVAELLHGLPREQQSTALAQRVHARFQEQDSKLQAAQQEAGRFRWGSQYIGRKEYEALKAREQEIQQQLDGMAVQFAEIEGRLAEIDDQIEANEQTLRQIQASTLRRTWEGFLYRAPLPSVYYEIQRDTERLRREREGALAEMDRLRAVARRTQQQLPRPKFTGVQMLIGVEGTPLAAPLAVESPAPLPPAEETDAGRTESSVVIGPPRATTRPVE